MRFFWRAFSEAMLDEWPSCDTCGDCCKSTEVSLFRLDANVFPATLARGNNMFNDADQLKAEIRALTPDDFFDTHLSGGHSKYFSEYQLAHFCETFSANFDVDLTPDFVTMVGSGKLGFAMHEKRKLGNILEAFRPFSGGSDIDLTICHPELFNKIWFELSAHACLQNHMPWRHENLADYLMYGWLRPDKFPKGVALTHCDKFYETVGYLRRGQDQRPPKALSRAVL